MTWGRVSAQYGETDFVICHPAHGILTVEVKGGGIAYDATTGSWSSLDRRGEKHDIKDPMRQGRTAKYSILAKLGEHPRWHTSGSGKVLCGHSVFFPDIADTRTFVRPDLPQPLIGGADGLSRLESWVAVAYEYWRNNDEDQAAIGNARLAIFHDVFARSFEVKPPLSLLLADEEAQRLRLTEDQARVLDLLQSRRRVAVSGGAGTGKTVLAVEKATRLACQGFRTLLTCYNQQLANHLAANCRGIANLDVMSFHQLCRRRVAAADKVSGRNLLTEAMQSYPGENEWDVIWPNALSYTVDVLGTPYDAVVCDEGQDFREDFWLPLELLLEDPKTSPLYIFLDENQDLYKRSSGFPIADAPFPLTINCRNTKTIHAAAYNYYHGITVEPPKIQGHDIRTISAPSLIAQGRKLHAQLVELISKEGVRPIDVTVLIADSFRKSGYYEALRHLALPAPATWLEEGLPASDRVLMDTVKRFKGLETAVLFLWGLDTLDFAAEAEILYVGLSRAKSMLFLVGIPEVCERVLNRSDD